MEEFAELEKKADEAEKDFLSTSERILRELNKDKVLKHEWLNGRCQHCGGDITFMHRPCIRKTDKGWQRSIEWDGSGGSSGEWRI